MGIFSYGCWDLRVLFDQLDETYMVAADFNGATNTYVTNGVNARRHQDRSRLADKTDFDRDLLCSDICTLWTFRHKHCSVFLRITEKHSTGPMLRIG